MSYSDDEMLDDLILYALHNKGQKDKGGKGGKQTKASMSAKAASCPDKIARSDSCPSTPEKGKAACASSEWGKAAYASSEWDKAGYASTPEKWRAASCPSTPNKGLNVPKRAQSVSPLKNSPTITPFKRHPIFKLQDEMPELELCTDSDDEMDIDLDSCCIDIPHMSMWRKEAVFNGLKFKGPVSYAALCTAFYMPETKIMLDCGVPTVSSPENIFITHPHFDHMSQLTQIIMSSQHSRKQKSHVIPSIYVPAASHEEIKLMIDATLQASKGTKKSYDGALYKIIPVTTKFPINVCNSKWEVTPIKCYHTRPCIGYGFTEKRNKLFPEFAKLKEEHDLEHEKDPSKPKGQTVLNELAQAGVKLSDKINYPLFCFLGDTNEKILDDEQLYNWKLIFIECTFIFDENLQEAAKTRHMHWKYLRPYIMSRPDTTFVLYHFSMQNFSSKKNAGSLKKFFVKEFAQYGINNAVPWL